MKKKIVTWEVYLNRLMVSEFYKYRSFEKKPTKEQMRKIRQRFWLSSVRLVRVTTTREIVKG